MTKFKLKVFLKAAYELILVFLQFFIIALHFFQWEFLPKKQITFIIKFKIDLEDQYLNNKFKNYLLYKNNVKV